MNNNAKKWVEALRSGEYKQTKGILHDEDGFCCLGVACDLAVKDGVPIRAQKKGDYWLYDGKSSTLPQSVQKWLGLTSNNGEYEDTYLVNDNDRRYSFATIADIIEQYQEELFEKGK